MQLIQRLGVGLLFVGLGCAPMQTMDLRSEVPSCAGRPDLRGLSVYVFHAERNTSFKFGENGVKTSPVDDSPLTRISRNDSGLNFLARIQEAFPKEPARLPTGEQLGFPAASSRDGTKWAAAIISGTEKRTPELVVRDRGDFRRERNLDGFDLGTLVWSPNSTLLAAIESRSSTSVRSLRDLLSPHPVPYSDFVLTIYRPSGERVCQSLLEQGVRYATVRAEWLSP